MKNIRDHILPFVSQGLAHFDVQGDQAGVVFHDENEFIPFGNLGYNSDLGWFPMNNHPDADNVTSNEWPWSVCETMQNDGQSTGMFALIPDDGNNGYLLGERYEVFEIWQRLGEFLFNDILDEPISESAEELGHKHYSISEAAQVAQHYAPDVFQDNGALLDRIRRQAQRNAKSIGATKTPSHQWRFEARRFRGWLVKTVKRQTT